jgi:hypothetical protein
MKVLAISIVAGAALCSAMAVPASAIPMSNLATAVSDLAPSESVRYVRPPRNVWTTSARKSSRRSAAGRSERLRPVCDSLSRSALVSTSLSPPRQVVRGFHS